MPQWNCACFNCQAARSRRAPRRTQSCVAVSADGRAPWFLLNCSPDIACQIESFSPLHPANGRSTPIAGVFLTDANLDHIGGLAVLRQAAAASPFQIYSSAIVREIASVQPSFAHFAALPHRWLDVPLDECYENAGNEEGFCEAFAIRAVAVSGSTPGYDGRRRMRGAVVAYEIAQRGSEARLLFAPVFCEIDERLHDAIQHAAVAFLDGSFYSEHELEAVCGIAMPARSMGHRPVGGRDGTLSRLGKMRSRIIFTHLNHSNPMLDPGSQASTSLRDSRAEVAYDGMELTL